MAYQHHSQKAIARREGLVNPARRYFDHFFIDKLITLCDYEEELRDSEYFQYLVRDMFLVTGQGYHGVNNSGKIIAHNSKKWPAQYHFMNIEHFRYENLRQQERQAVFLDYCGVSGILDAPNHCRTKHPSQDWLTNHGPVRQRGLYQALKRMQDSDQHFFVAVNFLLCGQRGIDYRYWWEECVEQILSVLSGVDYAYPGSYDYRNDSGTTFKTIWLSVNQPDWFTPGPWKPIPRPTVRYAERLVDSNVSYDQIARWLKIKPRSVATIKANKTRRKNKYARGRRESVH